MKEGMKKDIQEDIKKLSGTTFLGDAVPDMGAVLKLSGFAGES